MSQISEYMSDLVIKPTKTPNGYNVGFGFVTFFKSLRIRFTICKSKVGALFINWPQQSYVKDNKTEYMDLISFTDETNRKSASEFIVKEFNKQMGISRPENKVEEKPIVSFGGFGNFNEVIKEEVSAADDNDPIIEDPVVEEKKPKKQLVKWK